jgi:hypothetical protein
MPNWCNNELRIRSADPATLARYRAAIEAGRLCAECRPEPDSETYRASLGAPGAFPEWYEWRVEAWGTKWEIAPRDTGEIVETTDEIRVRFQSAWSPPDKALRFAAERDGFSFVLFYDEPGVGFVGRATEDGDDCREFDEVDDETRAAWSAEGYDAPVYEGNA